MPRDVSNGLVAVRRSDSLDELLAIDRILLRPDRLQAKRRNETAHLRSPLEGQTPRPPGKEAGAERVSPTGRVGDLAGRHDRHLHRLGITPVDDGAVAAVRGDAYADASENVVR